LFTPDIKLQNLLEKNIRQVIKSNLTKVNYYLLYLEINKFIKKNKLDGLILGCAELPIIFSKLKSFNKINIFDCLDISANSIINYLSTNTFPFCQRGIPRVYERKGI
jgi:aspartate/glutamate racemase